MAYSEYLSIFLFLLLALVISVLIFGLSYIFGTKTASWQSDVEKLSAYECGFDPFDDARKTLDVRFYLVGILFIIFDLEVSFLFPFAVCLGQLPGEGILSMLVFLAILTLGFVYEWKKGALAWE